VEHRQQSNAEIHNDMYLTLTGQEDYVNPFTHEVERGSNEWKYRWVTPSGEEVYSNADNYDPNFDSNTNRTDFKRSTVRQRARDRRGPGAAVGSLRSPSFRSAATRPGNGTSIPFTSVLPISRFLPRPRQ
jgi:hypothetical protein